MTDQYVTVQIKKRFDEKGEPTCDGCPLGLTDCGSDLPFGDVIDCSVDARPSEARCPIHGDQLTDPL